MALGKQAESLDRSKRRIVSSEHATEKTVFWQRVAIS